MTIRLKQYPILILVLLMVALSCKRQSTVITFELDMRPAIAEGWFSTDNDQVGLRGDQQPLSWSETYLANATNADGIYSLKIPFSIAGDSLELSYKIKTEGAGHPEEGWQTGHNHRLVLYKGQQQTVKLSWDTQAPQPSSSITGNVDILRQFDSGELARRDIFIYLPPGYQSSNQHYDVLYMHDGQNLFDAASTGQEWGLDEVAEDLITSGKIAPLIIVGIGNTSNRMDEYTPTRQHWSYNFIKVDNKNEVAGHYQTDTGEALQVKTQSDTLLVIIPGSDEWQRLEARSDTSYYLPRAGIHFTFQQDKQGSTIHASKPPMGGKGPLYENFILNQLKPYIDSTYRTNPSAEHTSLGGSSLGGLISLYAGLRHPETFQNLLILSPSLWWDNKMMFDWVNTIEPSSHQRIWLYIGGAEGEETVSNVRAMKQLLIDNGWQLQYKEAEHEQHNETAWKKQAANILHFVAGNNKAQ
ncbi:alpha/beta hydrolase [Carboxylicivirga sediminis]|uniref:Alpha/beta hydrolase n=1 Tax=Carboxylicivirga sediminis TaxID=2006564 RepID=A0A941IYF0_9BACT|nr:alpha/beta hydrolase-fold protein [Carboxylicivirga sediminis]MBR8537811.1 alpha/beta hydrolase [Carboxylicivirga sediminis]